MTPSGGQGNSNFGKVSTSGTGPSTADYRLGYARFNTNIVPIEAVITSASLLLPITSRSEDIPGFRLCVDYHNCGATADEADWTILDSSESVAIEPFQVALLPAQPQNLTLINLALLPLVTTGFRVAICGDQLWNPEGNVTEVVTTNELVLYLEWVRQTNPTNVPTTSPSQSPTLAPSQRPSVSPTQTPSVTPTQHPSVTPTQQPSVTPTQQPSAALTQQPSVTPTQQPSAALTQQPSVTPTQQLSVTPTQQPSVAPTQQPTKQPSLAPTQQPTQQPTIARTTLRPTLQPTASPTNVALPLQILEDTNYTGSLTVTSPLQVLQGTLTVFGDLRFTQGSNLTLNSQQAISASGAVTVGGPLTLQLAQKPQGDVSVQLVSGASVSGTFSQVSVVAQGARTCETLSATQSSTGGTLSALVSVDSSACALHPGVYAGVALGAALLVLLVILLLVRLQRRNLDAKTSKMSQGLRDRDMEELKRMRQN